MNVWFLNHPKNQNHSHPWVGATATTLIMSIFFLVRHSTRCDGFRIASAGTKKNVRHHRSGMMINGIASSRSSSLREVCHVPTTARSYSTLSLVPSWRRQSISATSSKALYSTKDHTEDLTQSLLYQQFKDLSLEIQRHDEIYYGVGENSINSNVLSDDEFDALVRKEEELEKEFPDILHTWQLESGLGKAATRSGRVGTKTETKATNAERQKRKHLSPMLSLDNVHNQEQLLAWLRKVVKAVTAEAEEQEVTSMVTIVTEPKLDGVSLSLRYEASSNAASSDSIPLELKWASTRGDGTVGQDVTAAAKQMSGIPDTIYLSKDTASAGQEIILEVRGEVVLPRSEFLKIQQQAEAATKEKESEERDDQNFTEVSKTADPTIISFSNPRNAASGIMLRKESDDPEEQASSKKLRSLLRFYAYDLSGLEEEQGSGQVLELDGIQIREQLSKWGFPLALPVATTNLEWKNNNDDDDGEDTSTSDLETEVESASASASESKTLWGNWFQENIANEQILPILEYFSALEEHRERLQEEDNKNLSLSTTSKSSTTKKSKNSESNNHYEWGDFDMDGCVHKVTQASVRSVMGYTSKSPKWATAHKFPAQSSVARLLDIIFQVGRTGAITPVAVLEPTEVGGVTVQRATLHNFGHLQEIMGFENNKNSEAGVSRIPKYEPLLVQRAGDVIPQVVRRIKSHSKPSEEGSSPIEWISLDSPDKCPFCSSPVTYDTLAQSSSSSRVGQVLRCTGPPLLCPPRAITSLKHAFSRDAMDLTGLSEARIEQLMDADLLKFPSDIFTMDNEKWESLEALPGWGERSSQNLKASSQKVASKGISLGRFIYSLGIRHVGKHTSELVASCYGSVGAFLEALNTSSQYQIIEPQIASNDEPDDGEGLHNEEKITTSPNHPFLELENKLGIGPVAIDSLIAFSKTQELVDAAKTLAESLNVLEQDVVIEEHEDDPSGSLSTASGSKQPWKGFRVVFTGSLGIVDGLTRSKAQEIAKQLGAKATPGSVSKSTDLVVFGDKGGKKLTQAKELGIATLEAEEFVQLANENGLLDVD